MDAIFQSVIRVFRPLRGAVCNAVLCIDNLGELPAPVDLNVIKIAIISNIMLPSVKG